MWKCEEIFNKNVKIVEKFNLKILYTPSDQKEILISAYKTNNPGLNFTGFYKNFDSSRIQIIGDVEVEYLKELSFNERSNRLVELFKKKIPLVIIDVEEKESKINDEIITVAKKYKISLLETIEKNHLFTAYLESFLSKKLVFNSSMHGVFVEVYGEGVLITGNSGIGKTELAVELIKRGHKLIADDKVYLVREGIKKLKARAFDNIRNFIEIKGIGIINIEKSYGMQVLKYSENFDLIVELNKDEKTKKGCLENYEEKEIEILGVKIPRYTINLNSYLNLPLKIEFLAMKSKHKKIGYDSQKQLFNIIKNNDI